jgi:hypothetical protein
MVLGVQRIVSCIGIGVSEYPETLEWCCVVHFGVWREESHSFLLLRTTGSINAFSILQTMGFYTFI